MTNVVEKSTDYGKTFTQIGTLPYGGNGNAWSAGRVAGACMVIIDATTVFVAGGWYRKYPFTFRSLHEGTIWIKKGTPMM